MELIRGITIDDASGTLATVEAIKRLGIPRPVARIVLDPGTPLSYYDLRVRQLYAVTDIMIQFGDSSAMTTRQYRFFADWKNHVDAALKLFLGYAKYWEVANEPNQPESFIGRGNYEKCRYALDACREKNQITVATYLMGAKNQSASGCYFADWIAANPLGTDLALSSSYLYQLFPTMPQTLPAAKDAIAKSMESAVQDLETLRQVRPDAKGIGWGETGGERRTEGCVPIATCAELCRQFYGAKPYIPNFVGGVFYWDYVRHCVKAPDAARTIETAIRETCNGRTDGKKEN